MLEMSILTEWNNSVSKFTITLLKLKKLKFYDNENDRVKKFQHFLLFPIRFYGNT